ncbi:hypothetical protein CYMTET_51544 [Cymbomonas tetramitiformis]|uniref:Uncharacterized protein n=1 Tax=Cymbomonas tetramitiformis TaxID=36881 RepID=A0AAE0ERQ3_9CHLO|nr:hypothetical protein CYMTET_51544 [Cymbomonas tetramitiformis]
MTVLKARGHRHPKGTGVTLDGGDAKQDFFVASRSAMCMDVLDYSIDPIETAKIFYLELAYATYKFDAKSHRMYSPCCLYSWTRPLSPNNLLLGKPLR